MSVNLTNEPARGQDGAAGANERDGRMTTQPTPQPGSPATRDLPDSTGKTGPGTNTPDETGSYGTTPLTK